MTKTLPLNQLWLGGGTLGGYINCAVESKWPQSPDWGLQSGELMWLYAVVDEIFSGLRCLWPNQTQAWPSRALS